MSEVETHTGLEAATLELTSGDLAAGQARLEAELAVHKCEKCDGVFSDRYHFDCPECGHEGLPVSRCRDCAGSLHPERVRYVAEGPSGGQVTKILAGVSCRACGVSGVEHHQLEKLDELAALLDEPLHFLPEVGLYTPSLLEVLADAEVASSGAPDEISKQMNGLAVRIGNPSELFDAALDLVTEHEPGSLFSPTLQVSPGPPYSPAQRRDFQVLLGQIQSDLGAPVVCWSASVGLSEDPPIDSVLMDQLMSWEADADGQVLACYHDVVADRAPGRFLNSVRLLELVLARRGAQQVLAARRDPEVSDAALAELVHALSLDLEAQLRRALSDLRPAPHDILQRLWLSLRPGRELDPSAVVGAIAAFPQLYLQRREREREGVSLPWEEPDFDGYARELQKLISAILG